MISARHLHSRATRKAAVWAAVAILAVVGAFRLPRAAKAQAPPPATVVPLGSLKTVSPPMPRNLNQFLKTDSNGAITPAAKAAAIALGKALFWDQAGGSDGQACASCHFNAGADSRTRNQLNPGFRAIPPDNNFDAGFSANYQLTVADFPFHATRPNTNDIVSSQGVFNTTFGDITLAACPADQPSIGAICDTGTPVPNLFAPGRNVEPRNTPTTINAVFNFRNFWDGRARNEFNGVDPIGDLDPFARVLLNCGTNPTPASDPLGKCKQNVGPLQKIRLNGNARLDNSSLASQAVGPPLSNLEMSFDGRSFPKLGKKMLALPRILPGQAIDASDSVLAGLGATTYAALIQAAFQDKWWNSTLKVAFAGGNDKDGTVKLLISPGPPANSNEFTQMEFNFSLFWGIAVQMYESTLQANDSPFDRAFDSGDPNAFTQAADSNGFGAWGDAEKRGLLVFQNSGKCIACHGGPETTNASVRNVLTEKLERMLMGNDQPAVYDNGFYNTAVTRCAGNISGACDDIGIGATIGPNNLPLSMSRFFQLPDNCAFGSEVIGGVTFTGCTGAPLIAPRPLEGIAFNLLQPNERVAVDGAFKTPGLRNIELTAPYFHNGGDLSLMDVVNFYNRGGNFAAFNQDNFDPNIVQLGLTDQEKSDLVALLIAMTDPRVRYQRAPFDHPQLTVPNLGTLPAVGQNGNATPLHTFLQNLQTTPASP